MYQGEEEAERFAEVVCLGWRGGFIVEKPGAMDVVWKKRRCWIDGWDAGDGCDATRVESVDAIEDVLEVARQDALL